MKHFQKIQWVALALLVILGVIGCEMLAPDHSVGPTAPVDVSPDPAHLANFWIGRGQNKLMVYQGEGLFQVGTPAGTYRLTYSIKFGGTFHIVFIAPEGGAVLTIGLLPGDVIWSVSLQQGEIPEGAPGPVVEYDGIKVFLTPSVPSEVTLNQVFISIDVAIIWVIVEGKPVDDGSITVLGSLERKHEVTTSVGGNCYFTPPIYQGVPDGASRSFKITPYANIIQVEILGGTPPSVILLPAQIQQTGGDGHIVLHNITNDMELRATCN